MNQTQTSLTSTEHGEPFDQHGVSNVALLSNILAKQLTGHHRTLAYRIKAQACSSLILTGNAYVNGVWPEGIVALNLSSGDHRLHIRRSHLTAKAREIVDRQMETARTVARMKDILNAKKEK